MRRPVLLLATIVLLLGGWFGVTNFAQPASTQIQIAIGKLTTGVTTFSLLRLNSGSYINWGTGTAATGYGIRDNAGTLQWKNLSGDWANIGTGGSGGAPSDAPYWTRTAVSGLSNESALGTLGTGLVKSTTVTGVPSIAVAADIIALWTGTCNGTTVLSGAGTCIGTSGGAPSTSTYITQIPDAGLSAEQALSLLTTGLMKVTTTTGVVSTAVVGDVIGLWTGTCNASTVLSGAGTCVANSGAPTTSTYITQTPDAGLSAEQALSILATGLMKVTTTTGVVSTAVVGDVLTLFTGTCNATTVLAGNGTCVTVSGGSGAPAAGPYWTRVPDAGLSNETALSLLGTGLVKNTTATGVPSIALVADVLALFTGTCNASTVLAGNGTCVTPSGGGGGAPIDATYITQTINGTLTNEQALASLATGLVKVTTTTGVLTAGSVSDITGYFTGCSATLVLLGNGTCGARAPVTPTYITRTADADLTGEQALSALTTGLMKVTTTTGVVSTGVVADILGYFTGTCTVNTVLSGGGTCVTPASTAATYITKTPDASLSGEQALSLLATGVVKSTTGTGVLSIATSSDIIGLWTGGCSSTTVLVGDGTCATLSTAFSIMTSGTNTVAAMVVGSGASLTGSGSGIIRATQLASVGTVPGISGCSAGTQTGGAEAGTFVSGTTGACTVVLTFARTAPTGWACAPSNRTTANLIRQTASAATTCTVEGVTVSGDVVSFIAASY